MTARLKLCYLIAMTGDEARGKGREGSGALGAAGKEADFGIRLRQRRLQHGFSLAEMARAAKVPEHYLEAIEEGDFGALPPRPYVKGFLDAYAAQLSLDPDEIQQEFEENFRTSAKEGGGEGGAIFAVFRPLGEKSHWRDWTVPFALAFAVGAFLAARLLLGAAGPGVDSALAPPVEGPPPMAAKLEVEGGEVVRAAEDVSVAAGAGVRVLLRAENSIWLSAEQDGGALSEWTMEEGETRTLVAKERIVLSLGNAGAVRLNVNGRELGFIGHEGEVKRNIVFTSEKEQRSDDGQ